MRLGGSGHNTQNPSATCQCLKLEQGLIQLIESALLKLQALARGRWILCVVTAAA